MELSEQQVRLAIVQLVHRHDLSADLLIGRSKALVEYVIGAQAPVADKRGTLSLPGKK